VSLFKHKNVVISGASRGIGLSIAKKLAHHGANIAILAKTDIAHPKLPGTIYTAAKEIENYGVKEISGLMIRLKKLLIKFLKNLVQ